MKFRECIRKLLKLGLISGYKLLKKQPKLKADVSVVEWYARRQTLYRKLPLRSPTSHRLIYLQKKNTFDYNPTHPPLPPLDFRARAGVGAEGQGPPTLWEKKIKIEKYTFPNKRNPWWNTNIRLADLSEASQFKIGPFRSSLVSILYHKVSPRENEVLHSLLVGKPQNDYLYKTALSRRLLRFHQPDSCMHK